MSARQNLITAIMGDRGHGKTPFIIGDAEHNVTGIIDSSKYLERGMKVLIVDTYDHPTYKKLNVPIITIDQIPKWKKGIYRFICSDFDAFEQVIVNKHTGLFNCAVIFEDAYKIIPQKLSKAFCSFLLDTKGRNVDCLFLYHAWGFVPKDLYRLLDAFEIFKMGEHPVIRKGEMSGCYERVCQVFDEVMKNPNKYYHKSLLV